MTKFMLLFFLFSFSTYAQLQQVDWQTLSPHVSSETVVLPEITDVQKRLLASVLHLQKQNDVRSQLALNKVVAVLEEQGLDVSKALSAREEYMAMARRNAESINSQIDGNKVRIAGFIVPIKFAGIKGTEFLLVPYAGASVHLPLPPANQIVKLSYPDGFEVQNFQYPVWVEGKISADKHTEEVSLVDGKIDLTIGYSMEGSKIERYYE